MDSEFLLPKEYLDGQQQALMLSAGGYEAALERAVKAIKNNLFKDKMFYLKLGVYWFAVKKILAVHPEGRNYGEVNDESMVLKYGKTDQGQSDLQTLIAAFQFVEYYNANFFAGNRVYSLGYDNGEFKEWQLFDEDMEMK